MILNTLTISREIRDESIRVAEDAFETSASLDQIPATQETFNKLKSLDPNSILYDVSPENKLRAWVVVVPTSKDLMNKFLSKEIGERGVLDMSVPGNEYSSVYLCAAVTLPEYRRQGIANTLIKEAVSRMPLSQDCEFFGWPTSVEGEMLVKKLEEETGKIIHLRK